MTTRRTFLRTALTTTAAASLPVALIACGNDTISSSPAPTGSGGATGRATDSSKASTLDPKAQELLAAHGIEADTAEDAVVALDQVPEQRPLRITGSVSYDQVLLADESAEVAVPLTGGQFYLSMAPYRTQTHDCYYHNLGGCQGELPDTPISVMVTTDSGATLVNENATTHANGFVGFWIPRDVTGTVTVTIDGQTATATFDSGPDGPTCLTTLQLA